MNEDAPTRRLQRDELARLAPFIQKTSALKSPLHIPRPRIVEMPVLPAREVGWLSYSTWLSALVIAGFAVGVIVALAVNTWQPARVALRMPPALPTSPEPRASVATPVPPKPPVAETVLAVALRRHAVDALLSGQTRSALEQYQSLLAAPGPLLDRTAIEHVVALLERELRSCEQEAGTPCGF